MNSESPQKELTPSEKDALFVEVFDRIIEGLTKIEKLYTPHWDARADLTKNIISVASGAIVLTVTFSASLLTTQVNAWEKYLLIGSWISFLGSIILAVVSFWFLTNLRAFSTPAVTESQKIREVIEKIPVSSRNPEEAVNYILSNAISKLLRSGELSKYALGASLVMFILALVLLGMFGWKRFAA